MVKFLSLKRDGYKGIWIFFGRPAKLAQNRPRISLMAPVKRLIHRSQVISGAIARTGVYAVFAGAGGIFRVQFFNRGDVRLESLCFGAVSQLRGASKLRYVIWAPG